MNITSEFYSSGVAQSSRVHTINIKTCLTICKIKNMTIFIKDVKLQGEQNARSINFQIRQYVKFQAA